MPQRGSSYEAPGVVAGGCKSESSRRPRGGVLDSLEAMPMPLHPYGKKKHPDFPVDRQLFDKDVPKYWKNRASEAKQ